MPSEIASCPETESTSTFGRKFGETRSGPRSRSVSACSRRPDTPPIAEPKTIPTRVGSKPFRPASARASRPAATPSSTFRSSLRASLADTTCAGSNPFTSPAIRTGSPSVSKVEIQPIPLSPASAARQLDGTSSPSGVTAPMPVTATRRTREHYRRVFAGEIRALAGQTGEELHDREARARVLPFDPVGQVQAHRGLHRAGPAAPPQPRHVQVLRGRAGGASRPAREVRDRAHPDPARPREQSGRRPSREPARLEGHRALPCALVEVS